MSIQSLASLPAYSQPAYAQQNFSNATRGPAPQSHHAPRGGSASMVASAEYYRAQTMTLEYTNKDGDSVSLSIENVEYQKAQMQVSGEGPQMREMIQSFRDQFLQMQQEIIDRFIEGHGGRVEKGDTAEKAQPLQVPEYWNAENTSNRIVEFATSFFDAFEGVGEEYLATIKDAIEQGFEQARDILGEVPSEVAQLTSDTYDLVMEKLDAWAAQQGIGVEEQQAVAA
jgi:hypothetical protein